MGTKFPNGYRPTFDDLSSDVIQQHFDLVLLTKNVHCL